MIPASFWHGKNLTENTFWQYRDFLGIHICGIVYHISGNFDPQMWYSIPHIWYTQIFFLDFDNDSYGQN